MILYCKFKPLFSLLSNTEHSKDSNVFFADVMHSIHLTHIRNMNLNELYFLAVYKGCQTSRFVTW